MKGPQVPVAPVRIHVQNLIADGMTQAAICRAAKVTSAYLSALLYGNYDPSRTPQQSTGSDIAARLLAVCYEPPAPKGGAEPPCAPGDRFTPLGYRVGRCDDCGQIAPVHTRDSIIVMFNHPRAEPDAQAAAELPAAVPHPDCGTPRGFERHRRNKTEKCEPCKAAKRGYEQGLKRADKVVAAMVPRELNEAVVKAMRALLYRRPYPQLRELAATVVGLADAELYGNKACEAVKEEVLHAA